MIRAEALTQTPEHPPCGATPWVPVRGVHHHRPWQGVLDPAPWEKPVTVVIPHLDTPETLEPLIRLYQLQSLPCNLVIIDTGSLCDTQVYLDRIEERFPSVEIHRLRFRGVRHPSDPVAIAMDLAFSLCTTPYLVATHADCFPVRRNLLQWLIGQVDERHPVAGYHITERTGLVVEGWVGHTMTVFDMEASDRLGLGWSQRRFCALSGHAHDGSTTGGSPDTEFLINYLLDHRGIARRILGRERNFEVTLDANIHHVRSYASAKNYSPAHLAKMNEPMRQALAAAKERIALWSRSP